MGRLDAQLPRTRYEAECSREVLQAELDAVSRELSTSNAELSKSRDRYLELFDFAPVGYTTLDRAGVIQEINLAGAALLGEERHHLTGAPLLGFVAPPDRRSFLEHMRRCRHDAGPTVTELHVQPRGGGTAVPVELNSRASQEGAGAPTARFHTVLADLRERQQAQRALLRSERLAALGMLTAGVAHEINNPLQAIMLAAQLGLKALPDAAGELGGHLREIVEGAGRCSRIVRNMLRFARDEPTQKWPAELNMLCRRTVGLARAYGYRCRCTLALHPEPLPILANPTEMEQALLNLVRNAAEAATGEACRIEFRTTLARGGQRARLVLSDDGPGIAPEHLPHVFNPFFTTKRQHGGTGLGLGIVHVIIADHGGTIAVEAPPEGGTRFIIGLPIDALRGNNGHGENSDC